MSTPHACPVCGGRGTVPETFYYSTTGSTSAYNIPTVCRTCGGCGIVWDPKCSCQQGETVMPGGVKVIYHHCYEDKS